MEQKKNKTKLIAAGIAAVAVIGLSAYFFLTGPYHSNKSIRVTVDGKILLQCEDAEVMDLFPKPNGGYRFQCADGASVLVGYATNADDPARGLINSIKIHPLTGQDQFIMPVYSEDLMSKCQSGEALGDSTGAPPLPKTFLKDIKKGSYTIMLTNPCRKLVLEIN